MLAFEDYFQISESSVRIAFRCLFEAIASDDGIRAEFLRPMDRASAERVTEMHFQKYGVRGLAFPLDCMHVAWKNGPMVWHGQFKNGKNKVPTIVLEAGADSNLWFWHASFGFPGTLNDLTIWARSPLLESLESGHWIKYVDPLQSFRTATMTSPIFRSWWMVSTRNSLILSEQLPCLSMRRNPRMPSGKPLERTSSVPSAYFKVSGGC